MRRRYLCHAQNRTPSACRVRRSLLKAGPHRARDGHALLSDVRQRQRLSSIPRGKRFRQPPQRNREISQWLYGLGKPFRAKRSSPPAEKCGVCIGGTRPSQGGTPRKIRPFSIEQAILLRCLLGKPRYLPLHQPRVNAFASEQHRGRPLLADFTCAQHRDAVETTQAG